MRAAGHVLAAFASIALGAWADMLPMVACIVIASAALYGLGKSSV
jgi:hypothetical protein